MVITFNPQNKPTSTTNSHLTYKETEISSLPKVRERMADGRVEI